MTKPPQLPPALQTLALSDEGVSVPGVYFNRYRFARLLGVSDPMPSVWHKKGLIVTRHQDPDGSSLVSWADMATVLVNTIRSGFYPGFLHGPRPGPQPGFSSALKSSTSLPSKCPDS